MFKKIVVLVSITLLIISCNCNKKEADKSTVEQSNKIENNDIAFVSFGEKITPENTLILAQIKEKYHNLKVGDTAIVKFESKINSVCQKKGCWMRLDLGDDEAMVKFKDYGFFMPKNSAGKEVIVHGKAYVSEVSIEEQRHYAADAAKSKEEIEAITEVEKTLSFEADGVLLKE
ncbi:MAG: DUF4920 domain-containing protein [Flavobacteriales bacterium]